MRKHHSNNVGVVIIGRNEGERLKTCIRSVKKQVDEIVYVDSGSTDGSVNFALLQEVKTKRLKISTAFSAGRARNEGFHTLTETNPKIEYVQFIDGDCELAEDAIITAKKFLDENISYAIVAGRRKERCPEQSIYNFLCDIEWDTPLGESQSCGGDFMVRANSFKQVRGFDPNIVAGEEPELCYRLRKSGSKVYRLNYLMTIHDANILSFKTWWKRAVRSGHAYAQVCFIHGAGGKRFRVRESLRIWCLGFFLPSVVLIGSLSFSYHFLYVLFIYPIQFLRVFQRTYKRHANSKIAILYSFFTLIDKWPQLYGQILFLSKIVMNKKTSILEYK